MTSVHFALFRDGPSGHRPVTGTLGFHRSRRGIDGSVTILPLEFSVLLVGGEATIDLPSTGPDWCWVIVEPTKRGLIRYVIVPESDEVLEYSSLPDVDPATLEPSAEPEAAWWAAIETMAGGWPLPAFRPDPDDDGALLVDLWSWQIASDDPNAMLVTVED